MTKKLIEHLKSFVTQERFETFNKIIKDRTRYMTVVIEDVYQTHNASAVMRSCDCFGVQDIHIIENKNEYIINPEVDMGSSKWLTIKNYNTKNNNTPDTIKSLKEQGYRIVATTPHSDDVNLEDFDVTKGKFALLFGTELKGLTKTALDFSDEYLKIPMFGFTESFNISVSAAIILHDLRLRLSKSNIDFRLNDADNDEIMLHWLTQTIKKSDLIIENFYKK